MMNTFRESFHEFELNKYEARYWNSGSYACAIVACVTPDVDWAAYIGGAPPESEREVLKFVAESGGRLSEVDARHFFPDVALSYRG